MKKKNINKNFNFFNLQNKENVTEQEKANLKKERDFIDNEMKKYVDEVKRIKEEERLKKNKHQDDLIYQIQLKEKDRLIEKQNKLYDERAAQMWEMEYQKKINEQRQIQMERVLFYFIF